MAYADAENATPDAFDKGFYFVHVEMEARRTSKSFIFISQIGSETKQGEPRFFENDERRVSTAVMACN